MIYLNRLIYRAIIEYDSECHCDILRRSVMACFLKERPVTVHFLHGMMPDIFETLWRQLHRSHPFWDENLSKDQAETALHNGLIFVARVFRRQDSTNVLGAVGRQTN